MNNDTDGYYSSISIINIKYSNNDTYNDIDPTYDNYDRWLSSSITIVIKQIVFHFYVGIIHST